MTISLGPELGMREPIVDRIFEAFESNGAAAYLGEPVTLRQHMLESAACARAEGAPDELVVAALLHDIGHLLHDGPADAAEHGLDTEHEQVGHRFLERSFPPRVVEPVRLHVAAKRYLCAVDPAYASGLSPASRLSLELQGGAMSAAEKAQFEALPHFEAACRLRRWDDAAKNPDAQVAPLEQYRSVLEAAVLPGR